MNPLKTFINLSIKSKIIAVLLIPIIGLLYFSTLDLINKSAEVHKVQDLPDLAHLAVSYTSLAHELQKERGMSAGFIGSKGKNFKADLPEQRKLTDDRLTALKDHMAQMNLNAFGPEFKNKTDGVMNSLQGLGNNRQQISNLTISMADGTAFYTDAIDNMIFTISHMAVISPEPKLVSRIFAYINFVESKEHAGKERAVGNGGFLNGFTNEVKTKFNYMIIQEMVFLELFDRYAEDDQIALYKEKIKDPSFAEVERMREIALSDNPVKDIKASDWFNAITSKINVLAEVEVKMSEDLIAFTNSQAAAAKLARLISIIVFLLVLALSIGAGFAATSSIATPLANMVTIMNNLSKGELEIEVTGADRSDEIGEMAKATLVFKENAVARAAAEAEKEAEEERKEALRQDVQKTAQMVSSATQEISQGNMDLSERTESQAANIEETTASMQQITTQVNQNAQTAKEALELVASTTKAAQAGGAVVKEAIAAMVGITESSEKITSIISVIDEIAFQTNLLALNAAVEAARAGEQGRGFAVVASEVRTLAGRSAKAAQEIKNLITESSSKVKEGTTQVNQTGESLRNIIDNVEQVSIRVNDITESSQAQALSISEINKAVAQMDQFTQQNAALVEEAAAASKSLQETAAELVELMNDNGDKKKA